MQQQLFAYRSSHLVFLKHLVFDFLPFKAHRFNNIDFCAMVGVSSSNAYQCICTIHTIYYTTMF